MWDSLKTRAVKESIAKDQGILSLIRLSPRQGNGPASPTTLRKTINAMIGAVLEDSGRNFDVVAKTIHHLGYVFQHDNSGPNGSRERFLNPRDACVQPQLLQSLSGVESNPVEANLSELYLSSPRSPSIDGFLPMSAPIDVSASNENHDLLRLPEPIEISTRPRSELERSLGSVTENSEDARSNIHGLAQDVPDLLLHDAKRRKIILPRCTGDPSASYEESVTRVGGTAIPAFQLSHGQLLSSLENFGRMTGESQTFVFLKDIIDGYREDPSGASLRPDQDPVNMSPACRFSLINRLGQQATYQCFLRAYHTHKLMDVERYNLRAADDSFIVNQGQQVATLSTRHRGNPRQNEQAKISKLIMADFFPDTPEGHPSYERKYRKILSIRKRSHRLDQLVSLFGVGLFGVMPLEGPDDYPEISFFKYA